MASVIPAEPTRTYRYYNYAFQGDQGEASSCVGFSWMHWLVSGPVTQDPVDWQDYATDIYDQAQILDEWPGEDYDGTSVRAGAKALQAAGYISSYRWSWSAYEVAAAILEIGPVVVGTDWYTDMFTPDNLGFLHPSGLMAGGHAYLLNGANTKKGIVRIKNSWGIGWGNKGHAFMTLTDLGRLLSEGGEAALAIEVRV